jgi:hypothetical protein
MGTFIPKLNGGVNHGNVGYSLRPHPVLTLRA